MDVYWLEQNEADIPHEIDWLSPAEANYLEGLRFPARHASWRLGRWTAKCAVAAYLNLHRSLPALAKIEVRPATSGAPEVLLDNKLARVTISLSHSDGKALCAVALPGIALGCDLEQIEPRGSAFITDYFTPEEQALIAELSVRDRPALLALLWSAKESALKALREGLRLDTRSVIVDPLNVSADANGWSPLQVRQTGGQIFHGWWQFADHIVRTIVAEPPPAPPISLEHMVHGSNRAPVVPGASENPPLIRQRT